MDLLEELYLQHLQAIVEECSCDDEDDNEDDDNDEDSKKEVKESDEDDEDEDDEDDEDEDGDDLEESFSFKKIKIDGKFISPSENQVEALENLFNEVSKKERNDLWAELTKDESSFRRIAKYAQTIL